MVPFRQRRFATNVAAMGVAVPATTLNPSDKAAAVTLSNGNLTATSSSLGNVRSTTSKSSGSWHFEVTINSTASSYPGMGVANATATLSNYIGVDNNSIGYYPPTAAGDVYQNNAIIASIGQYTSGTVAIEINATTRQIWFQHTSGSRQGPYTINATGDLFAFVSLFGGQATVNFGASAFAITPTSGFAAWG